MEFSHLVTETGSVEREILGCWNFRNVSRMPRKIALWWVNGIMMADMEKRSSFESQSHRITETLRSSSLPHGIINGAAEVLGGVELVDVKDRTGTELFTSHSDHMPTPHCRALLRAIWHVKLCLISRKKRWQRAVFPGQASIRTHINIFPMSAWAGI